MQRQSNAAAMQTYVVLQDDSSLRKLTLEHLCDFKLDATERFLDHRSKGMDVTRPYHFFDMHEENGDYTTYSFSIDQFPGLTAQQAYNTIMSMYASQDWSDTRLDLPQVRANSCARSFFPSLRTNLCCVGILPFDTLGIAHAQRICPRTCVDRGQHSHKGTPAL